MKFFPGTLKFFFIILAVVCGSMPLLRAANDELKNLSLDDFNQLRADSWRVVGNNVILDGNVYMPVRNTEVFADRVIVNMNNRDFEASGNVRVYRWREVSGPATLDRIAQLERVPILW